MELLRDLRQATMLLLLLEVTTGRHARLKTLADKLGMTVQGASEYVRAMTAAGLLQKVGGEYRPTREGVDFLHAHFRRLQDFVASSMKRLRIVEVTSAEAGNDVAAGARVGLFMERGRLVAHAGRRSASMGTAVGAARRGEEVIVRDLQGIVALRPGSIEILKVPPPNAGGSRAVDAVSARRLLRSRGDFLAVHGTSAAVLARQLGASAEATFGAVPAAIEAATRGLDATLLCGEEDVGEVISALDAANVGLEDKINYTVASLPTKRKAARAPRH